MRYFDGGVVYPDADELLSGSAWQESLDAEELADVLRSAMREEYADANGEDMGDALENVLEAMSPAEAFNFGSALNQIGKSATRLASDPAFIQVVRAAAPIAGGAVGTAIGGPLGTAVGSRLGTLAASALPARVAPPPGAAPRAAVPRAAAPAPGTAAPPPGTPLSPDIPPWASHPGRRPRRSLPHACSRHSDDAPARVRPHRHGRRRWREARRPRRRLWCFASSAMCCRACWRRLLASTAASRSAAFPPRR